MLFAIVICDFPLLLSGYVANIRTVVIKSRHFEMHKGLEIIGTGHLFNWQITLIIDFPGRL